MKSMNRKILIVEHDSTNMELIHNELLKSKFKYTSEIVQTKKAYVKALHHFEPDIILSNYNFPAFDGPTAFKIKERILPQTPFIFVSDSIGEEIAVELIKNGVSDFVLKENLSSTLNLKIIRALKKANICRLDSKIKQAEAQWIEELGQNESKFRAIFENSIDGILILVADGEILAANPALCKMLQKTEQEIIGTEKNRFIESITPKFKLFLAERQRNGKAKVELTLVRKDGSTFPAELSSVIFEDFCGEKRTSVVIRDITMRKKVETALHESEKKYRKIVEMSQEGIWLFDENKKTTFTNKKMGEILEYSPEEMIGKKIHYFMDEEGKKITAKIIQKKLKGRTNQTQYKYISKSGKEIWANVVENPFIDPAGIYKGSMTMVTDITERKKNKEKVAQLNDELAFQNDEKENRAAELIIANKELAFQNDEKENRAAELIIANKELAFQNDEKENRAAELIIANKELAFQNDEKENRAAELIIANKELAFQNDEKENRAAELIIANKELAFQNDEKENRAAELIGTNTELLKINRELDRFVYSVSHDLRSPLTSILGLVSFIEAESLETDTLEHIGMIRNSVYRLDEFIKNILNYSRNNRTGLEIVQIPLQKTVTEIVNSMRSIKDADGILFEIDIKEQQDFFSDRLRLNTLLENLISNAIKYHKTNQSDSFIKIIGHSDQDKLMLSIIDNGIGIASKHHEKIFEMFFRISGKKNGSGIGLYIVKDTVQILQGSIEVQSEEEKGTAFNIILKNLNHDGRNTIKI
jgi:PAS domain S-box-containing protein